MVNIKIKFIGLGIGNNYQAYVKIFDNNKLVFEGKTFNGEICPNIKRNKAYKIEATFLNEALTTTIYFDKCICLFFNHSINNVTNTVTLTLRDFYYDIPIERGEIILWPRT